MNGGILLKLITLPGPQTQRKPQGQRSTPASYGQRNLVNLTTQWTSSKTNTKYILQSGHKLIWFSSHWFKCRGHSYVLQWRHTDQQFAINCCLSSLLCC